MNKTDLESLHQDAASVSEEMKSILRVKQLESLLARVEAATGPDREIDAGIAPLGGWSCVTKFGDSSIPGLPDYAGIRPGDGEEDIVSSFTSSIDAAVALCERVLPGWFWRVGRSTLYDGWANVNRLHPDHCDRNDEAFANASSPSLALLAAILRAKIAEAKDA